MLFPDRKTKQVRGQQQLLIIILTLSDHLRSLFHRKHLGSGTSSRKHHGRPNNGIQVQAWSKYKVLEELRRVVLDEGRRDLLWMTPRQVHNTLPFLRDSEFSFKTARRRATQEDRKQNHYYESLCKTLQNLKRKLGLYEEVDGCGTVTSTKFAAQSKVGDASIRPQNDVSLKDSVTIGTETQALSGKTAESRSSQFHVLWQRQTLRPTRFEVAAQTDNFNVAPTFATCATQTEDDPNSSSQAIDFWKKKAMELELTCNLLRAEKETLFDQVVQLQLEKDAAREEQNDCNHVTGQMAQQITRKNTTPSLDFKSNVLKRKSDYHYQCLVRF